MAYRFKLIHVFPASPKMIYDTWLSSRGHTAMTGGKAKMSAKLGGRYTAWDGYISGRNLALESGKRIVQSWRTTEFTDADKDSKITVTLTPVKVGTRLTLVHNSVPDGHTSYENGGWQDFYFKPMEKYFGKSRKTAVNHAGHRRPGNSYDARGRR